jgi:hypothetical protein
MEGAERLGAQIIRRSAGQKSERPSQHIPHGPN